MAKYIALIISLLFACTAHTEELHPDCSGTNRWATTMAFVHLKNSGITDNDKLDFTKTVTNRLSSEKIGDNLFRQVHLVVFTEKSGNTIQVITVNDASFDECSMSAVDVYVISKKLGGM